MHTFPRSFTAYKIDGITEFYLVVYRRKFNYQTAYFLQLVDISCDGKESQLAQFLNQHIRDDGITSFILRTRTKKIFFHCSL